MKKIIMIGAQGQKDYVHKFLQGGCPCLTGDNPEYAVELTDNQARVWQRLLKKHWLHPHVDVQIVEA